MSDFVIIVKMSPYGVRSGAVVSGNFNYLPNKLHNLIFLDVCLHILNYFLPLL